jgi:hypothetical protein
MAKIRTIEEARAFRAKIESAALHIPEEQALESIELFPKWEATKDYAVGDKVRYGDKIYKCYNAITANPTWTPDVVPAHWEVLAKPEEEGTLDNPIAAAVGMRYFKDKYYLEGDDIYLCIRDDGNGEGTILHYWPSVLVGNYFTKVEQ